MSKSAALLALIEKLEKAEAGSRELDAEIWVALNPEWADWQSDRPGDFNHPRYGKAYSPEYSTSLDEALRLVPPNRNAVINVYEPGEHVAFCPPKVHGPSHTWTMAATPALALCIAALRARAQ